MLYGEKESEWTDRKVTPNKHTGIHVSVMTVQPYDHRDDHDDNGSHKMVMIMVVVVTNISTYLLLYADALSCTLLSHKLICFPLSVPC